MGDGMSRNIWMAKTWNSNGLPLAYFSNTTDPACVGWS